MNNNIVMSGLWTILNKQYSGNLIYNKDNGTMTLSIFINNMYDFISEFDLPIHIEVITGKLSYGMGCTLVDCYINYIYTGNIANNSIEIVVEKSFFNISSNNKKQIKFNEMRFKIPNIIKWSGLNGFNLVKSNEYDLNIIYKFKKTISQFIDKNITIEFVPYLGEYDIDLCFEQINFNQYIELRIKAKELTNYSVFFDYAEKVLNLIMLATGQKVNVSYIYGINYNKYIKFEKEKEYIKHEVIAHLIKASINGNPDKNENYMFYLSELLKNDRLKEWFSTYDDYKIIYELYILETKTDITDEIRFCNLMQALELLHVKKFKNKESFYKHIENKFEDKKEIITLIEENADQKTSPYIILKSRIIDILTDSISPDIFRDIYGKIDSLSTILTDTRNYYTHYNEAKKAKCLVKENLKQGAFLLKYILSRNILLNLGYDIEEIDKKQLYIINRIKKLKIIENILENSRL